MSDESKPKTMIGTVAPITRPPTHGGSAGQRPPTHGAVPAPGPSRSAIGSAAPPPAGPPVSSHAAPTFVAQPYGHAPGQPLPGGPLPPSAAPSMPALSYGPPSMSPMPSMPLVTSAPTAGVAPAQLAAWASPGIDALLGQVLCGYRIRRKLAEGGMGMVYEGVHDTLGRAAAIKVLKPELCQSEEVIERFHQEARAVNSIRHENIVDIYDFGRDDMGRVFFVMEFLEGEPLSSRLRRGPLPWAEAFPILDQTLRALKAAHEKGFVHRDLKPDNLWLRHVEGRIQVKLLDFGIAKLVGADEPREKLTQTGSIIGTPHYMSPEQINGSRDIDHRTDLYALGIIVYEMFTGATPFGGETLQAIMTGHLFKDAPRLAELPPMLGVPPPVAEIVERMLAKEPASRYESAAQVLSDLHDIHRHQRPAHASSLHHTRPLRAGAMPHLPEIAPAAAAPRRKGKGLLVAAGLVGACAIAAAVAVPALRGDEPKVAVVDPARPTKHEPPPPITPTEPPAPPQPDAAEVRSAAIAVLEQALAQAEPLVRKEGVRAVGRVKHEPALPKLLELAEKDVDLPVRGEAATAIATLEARSALRLLAELERAAAPELAVWYTASVARLGDAGALKRLLKQAKSENLAIAFPAAMALGELAKPGDRKALAALRSVAVRSSQELDALVPLLTKMAVLRDADAQQNLVQLLSHPQERAQLAAAEGLARLGDDAGRELLAKVAGNAESPNRLHAAAAQVLLGEYTGIEVLGQALAKGELEDQLVAARALGDIGQKDSLATLWPLVQRSPTEAPWRLRVVAAAAAVQIVGLDPKLLASASVDWTKNALASEDWVTRHAAAGVLSDLPAEEAVPLLARAIADKEQSVRLRASRSARKIRTPEAAREVIAAVKSEKDPEVREEQVVALGEIGQAEAKVVLTEILQEPGRVGVLAAGSLIAVGDDAGVAKLESAVRDRATPMRLAAVQAAVVAKKDVVIPTLKLGAADSVFDVQLGAAEGLSLLNSEQALAVPILEEAMRSRNTATVTRGLVALTRFGVAPKDSARTPAELVASDDPAQRLAAVPVVQEMPLAEGLPLLRRLLADPDLQVRRASVEVVEAVARTSKEQAIRLYKPLVQDPDDFVRSKAAGQLSRLVEAAAPVRATPVTPAAAPPTSPPPPTTSDDLPKVQTAATSATAAFGKVTELIGKGERRGKEIAEILSDKSSDDADQRAKAALGELEKLQAAARGELRELEQAVAAAETAAGSAPSAEAAALVASAREQRAKAAAQLEALEKETKQADKEIDALAAVDISTLLRTARLALGRGKLGEAERDLGEVAQALKKSGGKNSEYELLMGQLHYSKADFTSDPAAKRKALGKAREAYQRAAGLGKRAEAQKMIGAIDEDLAALGP